MSDEKKPDIIVWDEERGYYARMLPYGSNVGAPPIKPDNITAWKQASVVRSNHYFDTKWTELKKQYEELLDEYRYNEMVYNAKFAFEPVVGQVYYLYDEGHNMFLSIISPDEWNATHRFVGAFRFDSGNRWERVKNEKD